MKELVEMKKMLEKQLQLLSEQSENSVGVSGMELAALSEQVVNVGKLLLEVSPAANRMMGVKS